MNYYISDLHLFHKNVTAEGVNFDNRPFQTIEEMHETMLKNWNTTVTNGDHVYILGDVSMRGNVEKVVSLVSQLKGNKHLIIGNHDITQDQRFRQLFIEVCDYKHIVDQFKGTQYNLILSHFPIMMWNGQHRGWIHLYGHLHGKETESLYQDFLRQFNDKMQSDPTRNEVIARAFNVGCMLPYMDYTPRTLEEIMNSNSN